MVADLAGPGKWNPGQAGPMPEAGSTENQPHGQRRIPAVLGTSSTGYLWTTVGWGRGMLVERGLGSSYILDPFYHLLSLADRPSPNTAKH